MRRIIGCFLFLTLAFSTAWSADLFQDLYSRADGSAPQGWTAVGGEGWVIQDTSLVAPENPAQPVYLILDASDRGTDADHFVQTDFWNSSASGGALLVGRYQDEQNFYEAGAFSENGKNFLQLTRVQNGERQVLMRKEGGTDFALPNLGGVTDKAERFVLRLVFSAPHVVVTLGRGPTTFSIEVDDTALSGGKAGVGAVGGSVRFDNFLARDTVRTVFVPGMTRTVRAAGAPSLAAVTGGVAQPAAPTGAAASSAAGPAGGSGPYRVVVATGLNAQAANGMKRSLEQDNFTPAQVRESTPGRFDVLVGGEATANDAAALKARLEQADFATVGIDGPGVTAAAAPAAAPAAPAAGGELAYRVLIFEVATRAQADQARAQLAADDYLNVDVVEEGGGFKLYMGRFASEREANSLATTLRNDDYPVRVVQVATAAPAATPAAALAPDLSVGLSDVQRQQAQQLLEQQQRLEMGQASADDFVTYRRTLQQADTAVQESVRAATAGSTSRVENARQIQELYQEFRRAVENGDFETAQNRLDRVRAIDPFDPFLETRTRTLSVARSGADPSSEGAARAAQIDDLLTRARNAEEAQAFDRAREFYGEILRLDPSHSEAQTKGPEMARRAERAAAGGAVVGEPPANGTNYLLYGGAGILILAILGIALMLYRNSKREQVLLEQVQNLSKQVTESKVALPMTPSAGTPLPSAPSAPIDPFAASPFGDQLFGAPPEESSPGSSTVSAPEDDAKFAETTKMPVPEAPAAEEPTARKSTTRVEDRPPGEADVVFLSGILDLTPPPDDAPSAPEITAEVPTGPPTPAKDDDAVNISGFDLELPPGLVFPENDDSTTADLPPVLTVDPPGGPAATPVPGLDAPVSPSARIEDILPSPPLGIPAAPDTKDPSSETTESASGVMTASAAVVGGSPVPTFDSPSSAQAPAAAPPRPPVPPEPVTAPPMPAVPGPAHKEVYFDQNFNDEEPGLQPRGWQGEYDYATLTIAPNNGDVPGNSLKFEKKSGVGSANYVCHFPRATGRLGVEFDFRCDDKNKYLLGFYVEKDEDFKQSVHTIVHRTDSKSQPSLRIMGEPIPYELGSWRKIRYELNLMVGVVSAYVDGQKVLSEAKLPSCPAYVNTLSIRDNLATTGVLFIDNLKIYQL